MRARNGMGRVVRAKEGSGSWRMRHWLITSRAVVAVGGCRRIPNDQGPTTVPRGAPPVASTRPPGCSVARYTRRPSCSCAAFAAGRWNAWVEEWRGGGKGRPARATAKAMSAAGLHSQGAAAGHAAGCGGTEGWTAAALLLSGHGTRHAARGLRAYLNRWHGRAGQLTLRALGCTTTQFCLITLCPRCEVAPPPAVFSCVLLDTARCGEWPHHARCTAGV